MVHGLERGVRGQVTGDGGETPAEILRPPDQDDAAVVRPVEPFVRIGGPGVGAVEAAG
jgi:hypothetical protein